MFLSLTSLLLFFSHCEAIQFKKKIWILKSITWCGPVGRRGCGTDDSAEAHSESWKGEGKSGFDDQLCSLGKEIRKDNTKNLGVLIRKNPLFCKRKGGFIGKCVLTIKNVCSSRNSLILCFCRGRSKRSDWVMDKVLSFDAYKVFDCGAHPDGNLHYCYSSRMTYDIWYF